MLQWDTESASMITSTLLNAPPAHILMKLKHYSLVPFSRKIVRLRNIHKLLTALLRSYKDPACDTNHQANIKHKLSLFDIEAPPDLPSCQTMVKVQFKVLKAAAKAEHQTHDYRQEFLAHLLEAAETKGDKDKARTIRNIKSAEQMSLL